VGLAELNKQTIGDIKQAGGAVNASSCYAKLYSAVGEAKIPASIAWIEDYLQNTDQPLVVMGWHREVMIALHERFKDDSVLIIGGVTDKEQSIQKFMSGDKRILIGNIKAAGTGLTLINASSMLFVELPMTPADLGQAMDRIHRIGQDTKCSYYFIVGKDTIEERIIRVLDRKASMANTVVDNVADEVQLGNLLLEAINGQ
jgi:SWI/SNF-related matrix-associated actin-dependent regulator 1 of chromatin subfamily A